MESITKSLSDPGAWVSGILFSLIAAAIYRLFELAQGRLRGVSRSRRLKALRALRELRGNPAEIAFAIGTANAQYVAFLMMCFFYLGALLLSDGYRTVFSKSIVAGVIVGTPIFVFELVWLHYDSVARRLVKAHGAILKYRRSAGAA